MFVFSKNFIDAELSRIKDLISKAQFLAGSNWYDSTVTKSIGSKGLEINFKIGETKGSDIRIRKVRLVGTDGTVIAETNVVINKELISDTFDFVAILDVFGVVRNKTKTGAYDKQ